MTHQVLILGHSFISRLYDYIITSNHHSVDVNMGLDPELHKIRLRGYPGGNLQKIREKGIEEVKRFKPDCVILQIGSNDLCNKEKTVNEIAQGIIELVLKLLFCEGVKKVGILQILHRLPPKKKIRYEVDTVWFNERCDELNATLLSYFADNKVDGAKYWKHKGFWSTENQNYVFDKDGVHLNKEHGYRKYFNSVRALIVHLYKSVC